jgi:hypothetical protein
MSGRYTCFCEPLHEHLLAFVDDPDLVRVDPSHIEVTDYFTEYRTLDRTLLGEHWQPWYSQARFFLGRDDDAPDLAAYLDFLVPVAGANAPRGTAAIKFTRMDLRARWLRARFPRARIIHVVRQPRDLWLSTLGFSRHEAGDLETASQIEPTVGRGAFVTYARRQIDEIGLSLPGPFYRSFYALSRLSAELVGPVADDVWVYEEIVEDFDRWATVHLYRTDLVDERPHLQVRPGVRAPAPELGRWFDDQESAADQIVGPSVATYLGLAERL